MVLPPKVYTWLCGLFASLGSIIFGYDLGVIAGVLPATDFIDRMGPRYTSNENIKGLVTSIFVLGCFFGMFPVAYSADRFGRRITIMIGAAIYILGGALQTGAQNLNFMLGGRFFAGFGVGIMADLAPMYQAEIAHPSIRGRLTTLQQFMLGIGAFIASWVTYGTSAGLKGTQSEWRIPLGIQIIPALPLITFMLLLPESPRWLAEKGRMDEAQATLARLHAHGNLNDTLVLSQMADIKADLAKSREIGESGWDELFTVPSNLRRLSLGFILQFSVQMTGVSAIQYYSTTIFTTMGFSSTRILLFQSINSIIALIGEACCVIWIDRTGRRLPLIVGNVVSGLSFVVGAILMARWPGTVQNDAAHYIFIVTTWVFNFFFSACIGPLSWAYNAEIFSTRTRAKSTALTSASSWISNFTGYPSGLHQHWMEILFAPSYFGTLFGYLTGSFADLVFAICGHTNALFMWAFYPETTGRRLEEMDAVFEDCPIFVPGTHYAKVGDYRAAERELREGHFVPGERTEVFYEEADAKND
ncbi:hypothetical protein PLICRDRAFT_174711 [Plicaturopsis crispa FD-325 SS-3]|nr:hypothetical protein PLICRDRAFT_174711 [Plicaturopsis crispa FD-325 SS-3]